MSEHYKQVKGYYTDGLWNIEKVRNAVVKGWITKREYKSITGERYTEVKKPDESKS